MSLRNLFALFTALSLGLLLFLALPAAQALAGQTVTIDADPGDDVYGNGLLPNGSRPRGDQRWEDPNDNTVIVNRGVDEGYGVVFGGYLTDASGSGTTVSGNSVTLNSGTGASVVIGGIARSEDDDAIASDNLVTVNSGAIIETAYGGAAWSEGGETTATRNRVNINGGTISYDVGGGYAYLGSATNNEVFINGGVFGVGFGEGSAFIYGGKTGWDSSRELTATGNSVSISGAPDLRFAYVYGSDDAPGDRFSGNTLNLYCLRLGGVKPPALAGSFSISSFKLVIAAWY